MTKRNQAPSRASTKLERHRLTALHTLEHEFQFRSGGPDRHHVQELASAAKREDTLDPVIAWREPGSKHLYILDGHHRVKAYQKIGRTRAIRVRVFEGSLKDARLVALAANSKARLSMTTEERQNAAWRLVCQGEDRYEYSIQETSKSASVSSGQVSNMRKVRRTLESEDMPLPDNWMEALLDARGADPAPQMTDDERDELTEAHAAKLDAEIGSQLSQAAHRNPKAVSLVLSRRLGPQSHAVASFMATVGVDEDDDELEDCPF